MIFTTNFRSKVNSKLDSIIDVVKDLNQTGKTSKMNRKNIEEMVEEISNELDNPMIMIEYKPKLGVRICTISATDKGILSVKGKSFVELIENCMKKLGLSLEKE